MTVVKRIRLMTLIVMLVAPAVASAQQERDRFKTWDRNNDGKLAKSEFPERARTQFARIDTDRDGAVSRKEFDAFLKRRRGEGNQAPRGAVSPKPTHADVSYGKHEKQAFDIWLAKPTDGKPTPLVIYIHGGGFRGGDKSRVQREPIADYLKQGISFASMNYRLSDVGPYPIMMHDAARGLQLIRSKAKEWNLDAEQIACYGGSAGAGISLWLAFHEDLAQPDSDDPVARQSTRIVAAGTQNGQPTYDMRTFRKWFAVPNLAPHPALTLLYGVKDDEDWTSKRVIALMEDASPINHLTKDDPPVFMTYGQGDVPVDANSNPGLWVHHARLGLKLQEAMKKAGLECHVGYRGHEVKEYADIHQFLRAKVLGKRS